MCGMSSIRSVAILGAGTMGAQIAAHFANAGVPALLLDLTADVARDGLKRARAIKPDPFFTAATVSRITTGGFDTDLGTLAGADWIMEAVVEQIDIKPTVAAKMLFGALDEMATNWILSSRRYSLEADADAVVDLFINGARAR